MTALQLEPSAQAPCTNTIFGSVFTSSLPFARRTSTASQRWKRLFLRFLSRNAALPFLVCRTKSLCELSREPLTQPGRSKSDRSPRRRGLCQGVQHHEVVNGALEPYRCDAHPRLTQLVGIGFPLIAQHIGLGGDDERRGKPLQLLGAGPQRRGGDLVALARVACVLLPEPHHGVTTQVVAPTERAIGGGIEGRTVHRVDQPVEA